MKGQVTIGLLILIALLILAVAVPIPGEEVPILTAIQKQLQPNLTQTQPAPMELPKEIFLGKIEGDLSWVTKPYGRDGILCILLGLNELGETVCRTSNCPVYGGYCYQKTILPSTWEEIFPRWASRACSKITAESLPKEQVKEIVISGIFNPHIISGQRPLIYSVDGKLLAGESQQNYWLYAVVQTQYPAQFEYRLSNEIVNNSKVEFYVCPRFMIYYGQTRTQFEANMTLVRA